MSTVERAHSGAGAAIGRILFGLFASAFALCGLGAGWKSVDFFREGDWRQGLFALVFFVVFGGVGVGLLAVLFVGTRMQRREDERKAAHPNEPWLWKPDWAAGRITCSNKGATIALWIFALVWNGISAPLLFIVPREVVDKGNMPALLGGLFPLVGLGLVIVAARATIRWRKFGRSTLELRTLPGVIGGPFAGVVHADSRVRPERGFSLTLSCINRVRSGDDSSSYVRWQEKAMLPAAGVEYDPAGARVPVAFTIPYDCQPTDDSDSRNRIFWRLDVAADVPGVDYDAQFEVPVFRTAESSPDVAGTEGALDAYVAEAGRLSEASRIRVRPQPDGSSQIVFGPARNPGVAAGLTAFTAIWTGAVVFMRRLGAPLFFPIVFGLFDVLLIYGTLWMWLGETRVGVGPSGLTIRNHILGIGRTTRVLAENIAQLKVETGMQSGNTVYWRIGVHRRSGSTVSAGSGMKDKREAEAVAAAMATVLRLPAGEAPASDV